jgi:hypothetical protein
MTSIQTWVGRNQTTATLGAIAVGAAAYWLYTRRNHDPMSRASRAFGVSGPWTDLAVKQGMAIGSGLSIKEVQGYLNHINANRALAEDGVMGPATRAALKKFQIGNGIAASGKLDDETGNALTYFAAATSSNPDLQKFATVAPTYTPMLSPEQIATRSGRRAARAPAHLLAPVDIGQGWVMYGNCSCHWDDATCAKRCGGQLASLPPPSLGDQVSTSATATSGGFVTGIQSSGSLYDPRF